MKKAFRALAFIVVMLIATAPSPPLIGVTGTVYNDNGLPAPGTAVTFSSLSTQVVGGVEVPPSSFTATADSTGAISVNLPRSLRVNVVIGKGAPMAVTLPDQASIDLSALLAAVQVPPPASLVSSLSVAPGGDYALSVANPTGQGAATLSPGNVTRLNGNPVAALVPNPGQFMVEDAGGVAWEPFSLSGDVSASAITPGQLTVNHFTLSSSASAGGFKLQNLAAGATSGDSFAVGLNSINQTAPPTTDFSMNSHRLTGIATPAAAGDALSEGAPIGSVAPAAGSFTSLTASGTNGPALSNFNVNGAFNVKAYGAKGDGANDDAAAIQAAITAACAVSTNNASAATVYLPTGTYRHSKPLQLTCSNVTLAGAGSNSSTLYPAFGYGPAIMIVGSGYTGLETGTSLASGAGSAMLFDGLRYWLNLRDSPTLDLNGLSAFTVEAFVKPTATTDGQIVASSGRFLASSPVTQAFSLQMVSSQLEGRLNLGGTTYIVDSGSGNTLNPNTVYHVAMSWDGSTIRIFINGTLVASRAASGTIQQAITEDVTVGPSIYDWPDGNLLGSAIQGYVDSIRISKVGRYTATFTSPTAKFTADSNTLGLLNFDQVQGPLVGMYTNNSLAWIPVRRTNEPNGTNEITNSGAVLNNVVLRDFGINASYGQNGIFATVTLNSVFERLWINATRNGLYLWNNCYQNSGRNVAINTSGTAALGRIGLANIGQSGVNHFEHLRVSGGPYPLVDYEGSMLLDMLDVAQQSNTVYGAFFKATGDSTITLNSPIVDVEAGGTTWLGGLVFSGIGSGVANGGEIDSTNSAPAMIVDGGGSFSFFGNRMSLNGTPSSAIHVVNAPSQRIAVVEPVTIGLGSAPLSDLRSSTVTLNKDKLDSVSVNGVPNVRAYGEISGSTQNTTGSINASTNSLALASASGWQAGMGIMIPHAGPTSSASAPAQPTATAVCGSSCSTGYTYKVVALDGLCGVSAASVASASVSNNASLSFGVNYNSIAITPVAGLAGYAVYRTGTSGVIGFAPANQPNPTIPTTTSFLDYGQAGMTGLPCIPDTPPSVATATSLDTTISSLSGTTAALAATASNTVSSGTVLHDDARIIQAALDSLPASGGSVFVPSGTYAVSSPIVWGSIGGNNQGLILQGAGRWNTNIVPTTALAGLAEIRFINTNHSSIRDTYIQGNSSGRPLAAFESYIDNPGSGPGIGFDTLSDVEAGSASTNSLEYGVIFSAAPGYDQNNEEHELRNLIQHNIALAGVYIGHSNALANHIIGGNIGGGAHYGIRLTGGSFTATHTFFSSGNGQYDYQVRFDPGEDFLHLTSLESIGAENAGNFLYVDANAYAPPGTTGTGRIKVTAASIKSGSSGSMIDVENPNIAVAMTGSRIGVGSSGALTFKGPATLSGNELGGSGINFNSYLQLHGNTYAAGAPAITNLGSGTLWEADMATSQQMQTGNIAAFRNPCAGDVTLSGGSGSFTNACVTTSCHVSCTDKTAASAVKCVPAAGSVAVTGTGSDVVSVVCQ